MRRGKGQFFGRAAALGLSVAVLAASAMPVAADASLDQLKKGSLGFFESRGSQTAVEAINWGISQGYVSLNGEDDSTQLDYMLGSLDYIDECNKLRQQEGLQPLTVTDDNMAYSQVQIDWSDTHNAHSQFFMVGENLSWNYSDPFDGWYTYEKKLYDSGVRDMSQTGHYLNIVNSGYRTTGFAVSTDDGAGWNISYSQVFDYSGNGETVDQYRQDLENYINETGRVKTPMYRLYNPNSGEHFYTASTGERANLVKAGWRYEGIGWYAPALSTKPVYRLYNANAGDHHYTANGAEADKLIDAGWRYEGVGWYSDVQHAVPLYRQYNPHARSGAHNYTTSAGEKSYLVRLGWRDENIGWYGI
ncbi:MAG: CAP domain-containing protein [Lachnospiraceae bacterium]|nr:CAP domain-containing protein [Lachnospiraceae bacterium]